MLSFLVVSANLYTCLLRIIVNEESYLEQLLCLQTEALYM